MKLVTEICVVCERPFQYHHLYPRDKCSKCRRRVGRREDSVKRVHVDDAYKKLATDVLAQAIYDLHEGETKKRLDAAMWLLTDAPVWMDALNIDINPQAYILDNKQREHNSDAMIEIFKGLTGQEANNMCVKIVALARLLRNGYVIRGDGRRKNLIVYQENT